MRLVPSRPITIEKVRYGERWFPRVFRYTDGSLLLYVEYGHDAHFAPDFRLQSHDGGQTWHTPTDHVPRASWCHSFADGELFEIDTYGIHDPKTEATGAYFGAWSRPDRPGAPVTKELVRVEAPSLQVKPLASLTGGGGGRSYPTYHWWPLWNRLHGTDQLRGDEIHLCGPYFNTGLDLGGERLLTLGYGEHRDPAIKKQCVFAYESNDRGRHWREVALVGHDDSTPEGLDEATLVRLRDGRLYAVIRTGAGLVHTWSDDEGRTWTPHETMRLTDADGPLLSVWPVMKTLDDGTLVLVYGRPGKSVVFDPTGTGRGWRGRLDLQAWEHETQALMGVPPDLRLRGPTALGVRYWDSGDYLFVVPSGPRNPRKLLVGYDVQSYVEHWGAEPYSGVRMLEVTLED